MAELSIVEKALAKRYGSYAQTEGEATSESVAQALELFTGGRGDKPVTPLAGGDAPELWEKMLEAQRTKQVVGARCPVDSESASKAVEMGLVPGRRVPTPWDSVRGYMPRAALALIHFLSGRTLTCPKIDSFSVFQYLAKRRCPLESYRDSVQGGAVYLKRRWPLM